MVNHNFELTKGTSFNIPITLALESGGVETAIDLTGYDFNMKIKDELDGTLIKFLTVGDGIELTDVSNGQITLQMTAAVTRAITASRAVYDLLMTDTSNIIIVILRGNIIFYEEVTTA